MIGNVVYVGPGQVADARNGNLVSLRQLTAEWNAMVDAWDDIREITANMARFARLNHSWPCGDDIASMARAINTALDRRKTASGQQQAARPGNAAAMRERDEMLDALVRIGNWCAQDLAENAYGSDSSGNYLNTLNGLCDVCRPFMQKASRLKRYGGAE